MRALSGLLVLGLLGCATWEPPAGPVVSLWGRWEETFTRSSTAADGTTLRVILISPSGAKREVGGFWDGGETWRVRFMPDEEGAWRYEAVWRSAGDSQTATGTFTCRKEDAKGKPFLDHGAIRVSENGRYFEHADGTPFFWLADTAWNGALLSTEEDWDSYLDDRLAKSFTGVQFVTTQWRTAYENAEGQVAYSGREDITIHPEFFRRMDERIDAVNAKGLLAVPVVLWALGDEEYTPGKLPVDQAIRLARYITARYGAHHVAWFLGGDGGYGGEAAPYWRELGRAVFPGTDGAPVFLHPRGMRWPWDEFKDEKWLTAFGYQSGHGDDAETLRWIHSGPPATDWEDFSAGPIINLEPPYEDHVSYHSKQRHSAYSVRRATYWSLLNAPTAGVSYGAHGVWSWESEPRVPQNHERSGVAKPWPEAADLPGSTHLKHMAELLGSLPWWRLRPAPNVPAGQPGVDDPRRFVSVSVSEERDLVLAYLPVGGRVAFKATPPVRDVATAEWFDPRTGERQPAAVFEAGVYQAPSKDDWVLILRKTAS